MGTDKIKLAKEGIEAFSAGDWERFKAPLSSDAIYEELATQRKVQGPDQIVEASKGWKEAFPDAKGTITKVTEGADTVVLEITWQGTHTGDLISSMGAIPPSQKRGEPRGRPGRPVQGRQDCRDETFLRGFGRRAGHRPSEKRYVLPCLVARVG